MRLSPVVRWTVICWLTMTASLSASDLVFRLETETNRAFERGLLPATDFLDHHSAAEEVRLQRLSDPDNPQAIRAAMQPRRLALQHAVQLMERFQQPAAANWSADLKLLRHSLLQLEVQMALWTGEREHLAALTRETQSLAWQHYRQRVFDSRFLGHGSLLQLMDAAALLGLPPDREIAGRQRTLATLETWERKGAGIGRSDAVLLAGLELANAQLRIRDVQLPQAALPHFQAADHLAAALFADQQRYYQRGTATLGEMSHSWRMRRQIHDQALWLEVELPRSMSDSLSQDLRVLEQTAAEIRDQRGRIASDILYVQVLRAGVTER
ncbi:hypothetical protein GC163_17860 [bacterium]|nr:hypothetical protein [bacterium]